MNPLYSYLSNGMTNAGSPAPAPADNYIQQLQQRLRDAQELQQQLMQGKIPQLSVQQPVQSAPVQPQVSQEGQAVLALFEEFAKTDDGKQLVSYIGKFNSFCQSTVAKATKE